MKTRYRFNLIEIILTVAVIAFGVVVILGMLPKGLTATRAAGFESYASEIVDQMGNYLQRNGAAAIKPECADDTAEKNFIDSFVSDGDTDKLIMNSYPKLVEYNDLSLNMASSPLSDDFTRTNTAGVFKLKDGSSDDQKSVYLIVMGDKYEDDVDGDSEANYRVDFTGMLRTWKRPRNYERVRIQHQAAGTHDCFDKGCESHYELEVEEVPLSASGTDPFKGAVVCMELSFPLSLPYAERTKRYYSFEVGE